MKASWPAKAEMVSPKGKVGEAKLLGTAMPPLFRKGGVIKETLGLVGWYFFGEGGMTTPISIYSYIIFRDFISEAMKCQDPQKNNQDFMVHVTWWVLITARLGKSAKKAIRNIHNASVGKTSLIHKSTLEIIWPV